MKKDYDKYVCGYWILNNLPFIYVKIIEKNILKKIIKFQIMKLFKKHIDNVFLNIIFT